MKALKDNHAEQMKLKDQSMKQMRFEVNQSKTALVNTAKMMMENHLFQKESLVLLN